MNKLQNKCMPTYVKFDAKNIHIKFTRYYTVIKRRRGHRLTLINNIEIVYIALFEAYSIIN